MRMLGVSGVFWRKGYMVYGMSSLVGGLYDVGEWYVVC
jgi:hypothetical protein